MPIFSFNVSICALYSFNISTFSPSDNSGSSLDQILKSLVLTSLTSSFFAVFNISKYPSVIASICPSTSLFLSNGKFTLIASTPFPFNPSITSLLSAYFVIPAITLYFPSESFAIKES